MNEEMNFGYLTENLATKILHMNWDIKYIIDN